MNKYKTKINDLINEIEGFKVLKNYEQQEDIFNIKKKR